MPDKEGSDDEKKSTKSVVNKKQKQMMGEEGYDQLRDQGRIRKTKGKSDATTMPVSDEVRKTQKVNTGPSALDRVLKKYGKSVMDVGKKKVDEQLDLTKIAEAFGGYVISEKQTNPKSGRLASDEDPEEVKKQKRKLERAERLSRRETLSKDDEGSRQGKIDSRQGGKGKTSFDTFDPTDKDPNKPIKGRTPLISYTDPQGKVGKVITYQKGTKRPSKVEASAKRVAAKKKQQNISRTLKTAEPPVIKGGPSVKRGDPIPQKVKPVKKKPVPEIGGYQFNTFKDSEIKKRKTFKQVFGRPTGADPKTGKPTYVAPGVVTGKPRKSLPRSKDLPDYDTVKKEMNQRDEKRRSEKITKQNQKVFDQMFKDNGGVRKRKPSEKPVIEDPFVKRKSKKSKQTPQPENVKFVGGDKVTGDVESNFVGPKRARSKTATQNRVLQKIRMAYRKTKRPVQRLVKPSGSAITKTAKFAGKNPFATLVGASMAKDTFFPAALPKIPTVQGGKVGRRTAG